jgi:hypothetical protein
MTTSTTTPDAHAAPAGLSAFPNDHRGSPLPTWGMIATRFMELRKRRGLMIALLTVNIGLPSLFLIIRLISHAVDPKSYGPAGGWDIFTTLVVGVMPTFGFIVAATLGASAGSVDLSEGAFRHLVVTGRSRLALYFARIPAGLAIVVPIVGAGLVIVCAVCVFAAPTQLNYNGVIVPSGLSQSGLVSWSEAHSSEVLCNFNFNGPINIPLNCGPNGATIVKINPATGQPITAKASEAQVRALAAKIAIQNYQSYHEDFLSPPLSLMVESLLWLELVSIVGFMVGLGLSSLMGQRTVPVALLIIFEIVLTPIFSNHVIPHVINLQRGLVGLAMAHVEPNGLPTAFGGGRGQGSVLVPETTLTAYLVIAAWLVGWTALGAWRMSKRDV